MSAFTIQHTRRIAAPPATVYDIFADYHVAHPRVCPPRYFRNFVVERGGNGAGTVLTFEMVAFGKARPTRCEVSEPEPGRVLREYYPDTGIVTDFIIEPREDGLACDMTLQSTFPARTGIIGALFGGIERALTRRFLLKVYDEELRRAEAYATTGSPEPATEDPAPVVASSA
jgi:hypothetical protein